MLIILPTLIHEEPLLIGVFLLQKDIKMVFIKETGCIEVFPVFFSYLLIY